MLLRAEFGVCPSVTAPLATINIAQSDPIAQAAPPDKEHPPPTWRGGSVAACIVSRACLHVTVLSAPHKQQQQRSKGNMLLFYARLCSVHQGSRPLLQRVLHWQLGFTGLAAVKTDSQQICQASPFSALRQPAYQKACPGSCRHEVDSLRPHP